MDPITHAVIGLTVAKMTGNQIDLGDVQTTAILVGAVFPDIDILFQKWGDRVYLKNHRGVTHSIVGLAASSMIISITLGWINQMNPVYLLLWAFLGCLSHSFFDMFNSYGASIFWPLIKKRYTVPLMVVFDPVFIGTLIGYVVSKGSWQYFFLYAFFGYILARLIARLWVHSQLNRNFGSIYHRVSVFPSLSGFFRWHFVLEGDDINIIGINNIFSGKIKIIKKLYKLEDDVLGKALYSPVGEFFSEFSPLVHIDCENYEGYTRYTFIDMRYYVRDNFLHHAILEIDDNDEIIKASFNPYSIHRNNSIPT